MSTQITSGSRLAEYRASKQLSQQKLANILKVSRGYIGDIESGRSEPSRDFIQSLLLNTDVSSDWLLTGEGEMSRKNNGTPSQNRDRADSDMYASIPLVDVRAAAGGGAIVESEKVVDVLHFKHDWIHNELHANAADLRLLFVDGESMEPFLRAGDIILINVSDQTARRDGIYVLRLDDALLVKRLQRLPDNVIKVTSDNPAYQPFDLPANKMDGVSIIGRVVWVGRRI